MKGKPIEVVVIEREMPNETRRPRATEYNDLNEETEILQGGTTAYYDVNQGAAVNIETAQFRVVTANSNTPEVEQVNVDDSASFEEDLDEVDDESGMHSCFYTNGTCRGILIIILFAI